MIVCLCVCLSVCQSVTFWYMYIHFFIGLYLFNTATNQVILGHACTLGPGLSVLMFLVTLPSLIMLIYAKSVSPSTFWYTHFRLSGGMTLCLHDPLSVCVFMCHHLVYTFLGRPQEWPYACMIVCLSVCLSVCVSVRQHFGIHFFLLVYLFNTAIDQVHFGMHVP